MASVHPSRMGLVRNAEVVRPSPMSKEEELKMKLMQRRKNGANGDTTPLEGERATSRSRDDEYHQDSPRSRGRGGRDERGGYGSRDRDDDRRSSRRYDDDERYERSGRRGDDRRRDRSRDRDSDRRRKYSRSPEGSGNRERSTSRSRGGDRRSRRDSADFRDDRSTSRRDEGRNDTQRDGGRRASPSYRPYDGPPRELPPFPPNMPPAGSYGYGPSRPDLSHGPGPNGANPPNGSNGPMRMGFDRPPPRGFGGGYLNPAEMERRREERDRMELSVWPPSPKDPYKNEDELEAERKARKKAKKSKSKRSKRRSRYSDESSSETDSEEERERRRRRRRKEKAKRRAHSDDDSENDRRERRRRRHDDDRDDGRRSRGASLEARSHKRRQDRSESEDDQWVEKGVDSAEVKSKGGELAKVSSAAHAPQPAVDEDEDDAEVGPQLPMEIKDKIDRSAYSHMLKGEGEAMAAYAASGQRIPRRGEIGMDSTQIEAFEQSGYVMSGSRHQRMNAVRMRKENQVINAEEKRAILKLQREERMKKEGAIIGQFREMLDDRLVHVQNEQDDKKA